MPTISSTARYRLIVAALAGLVVALGLLSRSGLTLLPVFIHEYGGDVLWALLVYLLVRWIWPNQSIIRSAMIASLFSLGIEVSQLYHAPWIDAIRHTRIGGLVLGFGFLWSDLLCYAVGVTIGFTAESLINHHFRSL